MRQVVIWSPSVIPGSGVVSTASFRVHVRETFAELALILSSSPTRTRSVRGKYDHLPNEIGDGHVKSNS